MKTHLRLAESLYHGVKTLPEAYHMSVAADDTDKYVLPLTDRQTHDVHVFNTDFMFIDCMTNIFICYTTV